MKTASFTKALTVALPEGTYLKIREITNQKRISMGEWVRLAAERAMNEEGQCILTEIKNNKTENKKED